jgi:hypothetical protein
MTLHDHPAVGQGRQSEHHHPKVNRDVLIGVALVLLPWVVGVLGLWAWRTWR